MCVCVWDVGVCISDVCLCESHQFYLNGLVILATGVVCHLVLFQKRKLQLYIINLQ